MKTNPQHLEKLWELYRNRFYFAPQYSLSFIEEERCRYAFFAGCFIAIQETTRAAHSMSEEEGQEKFEAMEAEAKDVCQDQEDRQTSKAN